MSSGNGDIMTVHDGSPAARRQAVRPRRATDDPRNATGTLSEVGILMRFIGRTVLELPRALRYPGEIFRQAAITIMSSVFVMVTLFTVLGFLIGQVGHFLLTQIGAGSYVAVFGALASVTGINPPFFGFLVAAKIGCGYVAELGSMRINDEIDAMDVMGMDTRSYLIGTRVWSFLIAGPLLFMMGAAISPLVVYWTDVELLQTVSAGGFNDVFWSFLTPGDIFVSALIWAMVPSTIAIIIACCYGFHAYGGPVGVGERTARSMTMNVVVVAISAAIFFQIFFGTNIVLPIGN